MKREVLGNIPSKRREKAMLVLLNDKQSLTVNERSSFNEGQTEMIDGNLVLKTEVQAGGEQDLLSVQTNKDSRIGVNDFQDAKIINDGAGGSMVVDSVKLSHATGLKDEDAAAKSYTQTAWPADLENSIVVVMQDNVILHKAKIADFAFKGDEPQTREAGELRLARSFTLATDKRVVIKLLRPNNVAGAIHFLAVEFKGMQLVNKRK